MKGYLLWRDSVQDRVSQISTKQHRIATLYTALSSSVDGQDLPPVYSTGTDVNEFITHAMNFSKEVQKDHENMKPYQAEIKKLEDEIQLINSLDESMSKKYGVSLLDTRDELASSFMADGREAIKQTGNAQAMLLNAHVKYLDAIDLKSAEMLKGWDGVKEAAKRAEIIGAISAVLDIVTATGISGNAAFRLMHDEGPDMLKNTTTKTVMTALGLRGGQVGDYVSNWIVTGKFLDGLNKYGITDAHKGYEHIENQVEKLTGPDSSYQKLVNRLNEHIDWVKEQEKNKPDPNPFVPV